MKKMIAAALAAWMLLTLAACSGGSKTADFDVQAAMDDMLSAAPISDPLTLGESDMLDFYGIQGEDMESFAAVLCSTGISAQEIVLVEGSSEEGAKRVEEKLQSRLENRKSEFKDYLPDQYDIVSQCQVARDGLYVRMIIHPEAESLVEIYQGYLNGN